VKRRRVHLPANAFLHIKRGDRHTTCIVGLLQSTSFSLD
jgi:hypothetical protein